MSANEPTFPIGTPHVIPELIDLINEVIAKEREACAKLAEGSHGMSESGILDSNAAYIALAIRERGKS